MTRPTTRTKYINTVKELRETLKTTDFIEGHAFALANNVSNHLLRDLREAGFIHRNGSTTTWLNKPVNEETMEPVFAQMRKRNQDIRNKNKQAAEAYKQANSKQPEPVPEFSFEAADPFYPELPQEAVTNQTDSYENQIRELTQRVASLEQFLIRRGIA